MKVLVCHNYYQQRGGEDHSFEDEAALLESRGHQVVRYTRHNDDLEGMNPLRAALDTLWCRRTYRELRTVLGRERPQVMHLTNTFPLISPSAYYAARDEGVPVVQALRNYRMLCPKAQLFREDRVCEDCLARAVPWPALVHGCYRRSRKATAVVAGLSVFQRMARVWKRAVTRFYTPSEFARAKFIQGGLPAEKIDVKPNFVHRDPGAGTGRGGYAVFVGRLSPEKGLDTLLAAWSRIDADVPLRVVGDGPLAGRVQEAAARDARVQWLGRRPNEEVCRIVGEAACLVMPSNWYETFGRTIVEAYAAGTPVVVSRLGAMAELVREGETGLTFTPGDSAELADRVETLLGDPSRQTAMRRAARREYEQKYTPEVNYRVLRAIYDRALPANGNGRP